MKFYNLKIWKREGDIVSGRVDIETEYFSEGREQVSIDIEREFVYDISTDTVSFSNIRIDDYSDTYYSLKQEIRDSKEV